MSPEAIVALVLLAGLLPVLAPVASAATLELDLKTALQSVPAGVPDLVASMPASRPEAMVIYLHGWESCARGVLGDGRVDCGNGARVDGLGLAAVHARAALPTVLAVPQLPFLMRGGNPGSWRAPTMPAHWLDEVRTALHAENAAERLIVVAHSGGYLAAAALLDADPPLPIRGVVLLDALYGRVDTFADWLAEGDDRHLVSLHTAHPATTARNRELAGMVSARMGPSAVRMTPALPDGDLSTVPLVVSRTDAAHGLLPREVLDRVLIGLEALVFDD